MAIATATATPPAFLLFDFLLASSWTWFALVLATIAASLRVLFPRHRLGLSTLAPEASPLPAIPSFLGSSNVLQPSSATFSSASQKHSFKRRPGSKSTSSLEKLLHVDFWRPGFEVLSPVLDVKVSSSLKRIASASKVFYGVKVHQSPGPLQAACNASTEKKCRFSVDKVVDEGKETGWGLGLKLRRKSCFEENKDSCKRSSMEDQACADDGAPMWLPTWGWSLCAPSNFKWTSNRKYVPMSTGMSPLLSFEKQSGWDSLLDCKLGFPWSFPLSTVSERSSKRNSVVRMWDDVPQNLVRKLDLDEASTLALDTCFQDARACTGDVAGKVSMWELERRACSKASATFGQPVLGLSMNLEQCTTVVGSSSSIRLWDHRSSSCSTDFTSMGSAPFSGLKSRGNELCVATDNGSMSMYDLRKLCNGPTVSAMVPRKQLDLSTSDFERTFWERFASVYEEDDEVECDSPMEVQLVGPNKCSSLMSRLTTFVRAVTFML
ncbi:hypothetical protein L7F22_009004 [Adiantum nelumboides]|nr:hypothetical protein [Adiantum nelumboides]